MIHEIVQVGHPVLRKEAQPVDLELIGTKKFERLIDDMVETMRKAPGVGLAAPQIGLSMQLFVIEDRAEVIDEMDESYVDSHERFDVPQMTLINPRLETVGDDKRTFYEGCLSLSGFAAETERHHRVRVVATGRKGESIELDWTGWPARILQHEYDHLQGVLYLDRCNTRTFGSVESLDANDEG